MENPLIIKGFYKNRNPMEGFGVGNFCAQNRNYLQTSGVFLVRRIEDEGIGGVI
jgi:hypothetical protein